MDPTPELMAKLHRRLRAVEGEWAEAASEAMLRVKETTVPSSPRTPRMQLNQFFVQRKLDVRQPQLSRSITPSDEDDSAQHTFCRRKVRVPSWIVDGRALGVSGGWAPGAPWLMGATGTSSGSSSVPSVTHQHGYLPGVSNGYHLRSNVRKQPNPTSARYRDAETQLRQRLEHAEEERSSAEHNIAAAEEAATTWAGELSTEGQRLRELAASLRSELNELTRDAGAKRHRALYSSGANSAQLSHVQEQINSLGVQFYELSAEKSTLSARCTAISSELARQASSCRELQQRLEASKLAERSLQEQLDRLVLPQREPSAGNRGSLSPSSPKKVEPEQLPKSPRLGHFLLEEQRSEEAEEVEEAVQTLTLQENDLEFAYEWGLQLASRMSIKRALQLAKWAASNRISSHEAKEEMLPGAGEEDTSSESHSSSSEASPASDERQFEVPLADLVDALSVLQQASTARAARGTRKDVSAATSTEEFSRFEQPVKTLQEVLAKLTGPSIIQPTSPVPSPSTQHNFSAAIAGLQEAISEMGQRKHSKLGDVRRQAGLQY